MDIKETVVEGLFWDMILLIELTEDRNLAEK